MVVLEKERPCGAEAVAAPESAIQAALSGD
jgi:hypothetical protein